MTAAVQATVLQCAVRSTTQWNLFIKLHYPVKPGYLSATELSSWRFNTSLKVSQDRKNL